MPPAPVTAPRHVDPAQVASLLDAFRLGRRGALDELIRLCEPFVRSQAQRSAWTRDEVDDIVQEVWIKLMLNADQIEDPQTLLAWLQVVTRRLATGMGRRSARCVPTELDDDAVPPAASTEDIAVASVERNRHQQVVTAALGRAGRPGPPTPAPAPRRRPPRLRAGQPSGRTADRQPRTDPSTAAEASAPRPRDPSAACESFDQAMHASRAVDNRFILGLALVEWVRLKRSLGDRRAPRSTASSICSICSCSPATDRNCRNRCEAGMLLADAGLMEEAALALLARSRLPAMPTGGIDDVDDIPRLGTLEQSMAHDWRRIQVRALALDEPSLIKLCRDQLGRLRRAKKGRAIEPRAYTENLTS